jgi:hypothetical protein
MVDDLKIEKSAVLSNLTRVGPAKPIGYLPLYTIRNLLEMEPHMLAQEARTRGLSTALFEPNQCCIKSGALYVFDRSSLERLIQSSNSVLAASHWPFDADQFIARIASEWIDQAHPVALVVNRAFGESV